MPEFTALIESVNQNIARLEEDLDGTQERLDTIIGRLPQDYIPRTEADERTDKLRTYAIVAAIGIVITAIAVVGLVFWVKGEVKGESESRCRAGRSALAEVIKVAVADRQPLPTTSPEAAAAIREQNERTVRPLREQLLSLDGTQPEKC